MAATWGETAGPARIDPAQGLVVVRGPVLTARFWFAKVTFVVITASMATPDGLAVFTGESSWPASMVIREGPLKAKAALAKELVLAKGD